MEPSKRWKYATYAAALLWVALAIRLMIADVWDETNGMLAFSSAAMSLGQKLHFVLTQSLGFWRPLPTLVVTVILHFVRDFDISWRLLRGLNMLMLLAALHFFLQALRTSRPVRTDDDSPTYDAEGPREFVLTIALLFSGSAIISAGWYANIFDAAALLLIAMATLLLLRGRTIASGIVLGTAFFCKETAALSLPFLLVLLAAGRIRFRDALRAGIPAAILGAAYFAVRAKIVPFGAAGDVHGFARDQFVPTVLNLAESFWRQTLKGAGPGVLGYLFLAIAIVAFFRPRVIAAVLVLFAATAVIYWGMFGEYQNGVLMHHLNFVGRLYLVPVAMMLFLLALERRTFVIAVLLLPIVSGAAVTWRDHELFQRTYARIYRTARDSQQKPLIVHFPPKPLDDTVRAIKVGDFPDAPVRVDAGNGKLLFR